MCLLCVCLSLLFSALPFSLSLHHPIPSVFISVSFLSLILCALAFSFYPFLSSLLSDRTAAHKDVCFQEVDEDLICTMPRVGLAVTYSECCCHYGHGWGPECRTCPQRNSGELTAILPKSYRGRTFPPRKLPQFYSFQANRACMLPEHP